MAMNELRFGENRLRGMYDIMAYRRLIASVSDQSRDVAYAKAWNKVARGSRSMSYDSKTLYFYDDAFRASFTLFAELAQAPIDLTDHVVWLGLRDLVINADRLITLPDLLSSEGVNVLDTVMSVAQVLDVVSRLSDEACVEDAIPATEQAFISRWTPIYVDLVCGRGGVWLAYIDDMGAEAAHVRGLSWIEERDRYAGMRTTDYVGRLMKTYGLNQEGAGRLFSSQMLLVGSVFDQVQRGTWERDGAVAIDDALALESLHVDIASAVAQNILPTLPEGDDLVGYSSAFGVSPVGCIANVTRQFEGVAREGLVRATSSSAGSGSARRGRSRRVPVA